MQTSQPGIIERGLVCRTACMSTPDRAREKARGWRCQVTKRQATAAYIGGIGIKQVAAGMREDRSGEEGKKRLKRCEGVCGRLIRI